MDSGIIEKHISAVKKSSLCLQNNITPITAGANDMLSSIGYASDTALSNDGSKSPANVNTYTATVLTKQLDRIAITIDHFGMDIFNDFINNIKNGIRHMVPSMNATSAKDGNGF